MLKLVLTGAGGRERRLGSIQERETEQELLPSSSFSVMRYLRLLNNRVQKMEDEVRTHLG